MITACSAFFSMMLAQLSNPSDACTVKQVMREFQSWGWSFIWVGLTQDGGTSTAVNPTQLPNHQPHLVQQNLLRYKFREA